MTPDRQKKALSLWLDFVSAPVRLDVQVVDALLLRDELEATQVAREVLTEIRALDVTLRKRVTKTLAELTAIGVFEKIGRLRTKRSLTGWWWWMDRLAAGQPIELPEFEGATPGASHQAAPFGKRDVTLAA